jgi:predicted ATPase
VIRSVAIHGLRGIQEGRLDELTPLVVLVGPNGCGKSTVLDALLIGVSPDPPDAVGRAVRRRMGVKNGARWLLWRGGRAGASESAVSWTNLKGKEHKRRLLLDEDRTERSVIKCEPITATRLPIATTTFDNADNSYEWSPHTGPHPDAQNVRLIDCNAYSFVSVPLHQVYSQAVEQGRSREVKDILAEVVPGVTGIEILTEGDSPVVHLVYEANSVPAALAGDGVHALLRLCLELAARPGGLVLLEEPEVHQHPRAIRETARAIQAAVRRGVQVILTTHSLELIDALVDAARSDEELERMSVYHTVLDNGTLKSSRIAGQDVAFARTQIEDDLR